MKKMKDSPRSSHPAISPSRGLPLLTPQFCYILLEQTQNVIPKGPRARTGPPLARLHFPLASPLPDAYIS